MLLLRGRSIRDPRPTHLGLFLAMDSQTSARFLPLSISLVGLMGYNKRSLYPTVFRRTERHREVLARLHAHLRGYLGDRKKDRKGTLDPPKTQQSRSVLASKGARDWLERNLFKLTTVVAPRFGAAWIYGFSTQHPLLKGEGARRRRKG